MKQQTIDQSDANTNDHGQMRNFASSAICCYAEASIEEIASLFQRDIAEVRDKFRRKLAEPGAPHRSKNSLGRIQLVRSFGRRRNGAARGALV